MASERIPASWRVALNRRDLARAQQAALQPDGYRIVRWPSRPTPRTDG